MTTLTKLEGRVRFPVGDQRFCTLMLTYKGKELSYRLTSEVFGACGFAAPEFKEGVDVLFDAQKYGNRWMVTRVHCVGTNLASVDEAQLKNAHEKLFRAPKPDSRATLAKQGRPERKKPAPSKPVMVAQAVGQLAEINPQRGVASLDVQYLREADGTFVEYTGEAYRLLKVRLADFPAGRLIVDEIFDFDILLTGNQVFAKNVQINVDCQPEPEVLDDRQGELDFPDENVVSIKRSRRQQG